MCCRKKVVFKEGELYSNIRDRLKPFDVIFFRGHAVFSKIVRLLEKHGNKKSIAGEFSHVGMVVTSEILDHPLVLPNKKYILESTLGGVFEGGVMNIEGKTCIGVQLRDLDAVVNEYDKNDKTCIAWGDLLYNPVVYAEPLEVRQRFTIFFNEYNGKMYDMNLCSMMSSVFECLRPYRKVVETLCNTQDWYFCSEIVALAYKIMGIYPSYVNEKDVLPRDIAYPEADTDIMPKVIRAVTCITTERHYKKQENKQITI